MRLLDPAAAFPSSLRTLGLSSAQFEDFFNFMEVHVSNNQASAMNTISYLVSMIPLKKFSVSLDVSKRTDLADEARMFLMLAEDELKRTRGLHLRV